MPIKCRFDFDWKFVVEMSAVNYYGAITVMTYKSNHNRLIKMQNKICFVTITSPIEQKPLKWLVAKPFTMKRDKIGTCVVKRILYVSSSISIITEYKEVKVFLSLKFLSEKVSKC